MSIRLKLYFLIFLFGLALLINLGALGLLARTAMTVLSTTDEVLQQQSAALQMQALLRDAEAALYRHEIEGETGFATHFRNQLALFQTEVTNYDSLTRNPQETVWVRELSEAHQEAVAVGEKLIEQRRIQGEDLKSLEAIQARAIALLTGPLREIRSDNLAYQRVISGMDISLREMLFALISYQATPREIDRVRFMDGISTFRSYHKQFTAQINPGQIDSGQGGLIQEEMWAGELHESINEIEVVGSKLVSRRIQQKADFANFALLLFRTGQGIIVDEIQPQAAANIALAQADLDGAVRNSLLLSLITIALSLLIFASVTFPLLQRMNQSINALLRGADSVTAGDLTQSVTVSGQDEFQRLAAAFNEMMSDLAAREKRLRELVQKLALVQEEERRLVGLDLHDGLAQMLLSANMHLNAFTTKFREGRAEPDEFALERGRIRLQEAIDEVRWVVSELRPTDLEDYGLVDGIRHYVQKVAEVRQWHVEFEADLVQHQLTPAAETAIFRIVQEALSNARKFAETKRIRVSLFTDPDDIHLNIKDWGQGFEVALPTDEAKHLGLVGMQERAKLIGGEFSIESKLREGTNIAVRIPLASNLQMRSQPLYAEMATGI
ncbi:MAG: HAMP domain-containing protein [Chloroflexota bacterium]